MVHANQKIIKVLNVILVQFAASLALNCPNNHDTNCCEWQYIKTFGQSSILFTSKFNNQLKQEIDFVLISTMESLIFFRSGHE